MLNMISLLCFIFFLSSASHCKIESDFIGQLYDLDTITGYHKFSILSDPEYFKLVLKFLFSPRDPGSSGSKILRENIVKYLLDLGFRVEIDSFNNTTPTFGEMEFHNIIAKLNPNAREYIVLACHYGRKFHKGYAFVGATDSPIPCTMLMNMATLLNADLMKFLNGNISPMLIFFDGEQSSEEWREKDSFYSSQQLANKWKSNGFIKRIKLFLMLDFIGESTPQLYSFFINTAHWFNVLIEFEAQMAEEGLLRNYNDSRPYFRVGEEEKTIPADHLPFLKNNVPIVHLVSTPLVEVPLILENDDMPDVDFIVTDNIQRILQTFLMYYLEFESKNADNSEETEPMYCSLKEYHM